MRITTRKGDEGQTELLFGKKVRKDAPQVIALGEVDELNAFLGMARILMEKTEVIDRVQELLVTLMGELAMPEGAEAEYEATGFSRIGSDEVLWLEQRIEELEKTPGRGWLRPGQEGEELKARFHVARTVGRRAERSVWQVGVASQEVKVFMNRLSDWLWLMAREG